MIRASHVDCGSWDSKARFAEKASGATVRAWSLKARNLVARRVRVEMGVDLGRRMVVYMFDVGVDVRRFGAWADC